jgi:hypothetical protein
MSDQRVAVCIGPCQCGGYGVVYDEETERELGRCHDTLETILSVHDPVETILSEYEEEEG